MVAPISVKFSWQGLHNKNISQCDGLNTNIGRLQVTCGPEDGLMLLNMWRELSPRSCAHLNLDAHRSRFHFVLKQVLSFQSELVWTGISLECPFTLASFWFVEKCFISIWATFPHQGFFCFHLFLWMHDEYGPILFSLPRECGHSCYSSPPNGFLRSSNHIEDVLGELLLVWAPPEG